MSNNDQKQQFCGSFSNKTYRDSKTEFAGNWSRIKYDAGNFAHDTEQSTRQLDFALDPTSIHRCNPCFAEEIGYNTKFGVSFDTKRPLTDTESELRNLTRILSRDPNFKYTPYCPNCGNKTTKCGEKGCLDGYPCGGGFACQECQPELFHFPSCGNKREFTRISNPTCTLRETGVNRFQPTYLDHQDPTRWEHPGETGINNRLVAKDNHVPCLPRPIDQTPALPRPRSLPCKPITPSCANFTEPLHNHYKPVTTTNVPRK